MRSERGETLAEVVVAAGIAAMVVAAVAAGTIAAAHQFGANAASTALHLALQRELRIATDMLKYRGSSIAPVAIATTIPMAGASPAPAHLSIATATLASGAVQITLQGSLDNDPAITATLTTVTGVPVPLPQSTLDVTGPAPQ